MGIRVFAVALALVSLWRVFLRFRRTRRVTFELLVWTLVFSGIGTVVFVPSTADQAAAWLGVSNGFSAFTFIAICFLLLVTFRIITRQQRLQRDITALVRAQAIQLAVQVQGVDERGRSGAGSDRARLA